MDPINPQWLSLGVDHSGFASSSAIISLAFPSFISSLRHTVFPASFHFLYHPSISICWIIYMFLPVCLYISPSLRLGLTNASEIHEKERAPLTLTYCLSAVAPTPEPTRILSFPRPPEESFIRFPSLLGKDLGEKTMTKFWRILEKMALLSNLSLAVAEQCRCVEVHGATQMIQKWKGHSCDL